MRANSNLLTKIREHLEKKGLMPYGKVDDNLTYAIYVAFFSLDEPYTSSDVLLKEAKLLTTRKSTPVAFYQSVRRALMKLEQFKQEKYIDIKKCLYELAREIE